MAIAVTVKGKHHFEVTPGLREHAVQRLQRLEKYLTDIREAVVVESVEGEGHGNEHRVEVTLQGDGMTMRGEERTNDMYASLDRVVDKLEQRLKKFKDKHVHARGRQESLRSIPATNGVGYEDLLPADTEPDADTRPRIARTKAVTMKPMSTEDAMKMLELVDHEWYIYLDMDTNQHQVVYRRRDGTYGLVVPKI